MRKLEYLIPLAYDGHKLIHFLRGETGCSAGLVKLLKQTEDGLLLDGVRARTIDRLQAGQRLTLTLREEETTPLAHCDRTVAVLYEDEDLIIFNKPANMPSHPAKRHQADTLGNVFASLCAAKGEGLPWRPVNRLDRNTTGAVVAAKNAFTAAALAGAVGKVYLAVVSGAPNPVQGVIDAPIGRPNPYDIRRAVMKNGQSARTEYRILRQTDVYSVMRCTLPTGRTHQIRVHMAYVGCPLLGDDLYGGNHQLIDRQALHCAFVRFIHPVTGTVVSAAAPVPQDMQKFVANCEKR